MCIYIMLAESITTRMPQIYIYIMYYIYTYWRFYIFQKPWVSLMMFKVSIEGIPQHLIPSGQALLPRGAGHGYIHFPKLTVRPWKCAIPKGNSSSNHWFSGAMLVSGRVYIIYLYIYIQHQVEMIKTLPVIQKRAGSYFGLAMAGWWMLDVGPMGPKTSTRARSEAPKRNQQARFRTLRED